MLVAHPFHTTKTLFVGFPFVSPHIYTAAANIAASCLVTPNGELRFAQNFFCVEGSSNGMSFFVGGQDVHPVALSVIIPREYRLVSSSWSWLCTPHTDSCCVAVVCIFCSLAIRCTTVTSPRYPRRSTNPRRSTKLASFTIPFFSNGRPLSLSPIPSHPVPSPPAATLDCFQHRQPLGAQRQV